jgi:hypothetical protein
MIFAVLLQALLATITGSAGVYETTDSGQLTDFETFHLGSDACHASDNFMPGDHGKNCAAPLVPRLMDVRVADSAVKDFDEHIVWPWFAPLKVERF